MIGLETQGNNRYTIPAKVFNLVPNNKLVIYINKSIAKTLREFGIVGEKIGNSYFSKILKEHDINVLRRRNTMPL